MRFLITEMLHKKKIKNHTVFFSIFFLVIFILPVSSHSRHVPPKVLLQEQFEDLANWEPLSFPDMKKPCDYSIVEDETLLFETSDEQGDQVMQMVFWR